MDLNNILGVPAIVLICYLLIEGIKIIFGKYEKIKELLPIIAAILGAILGVMFLKFCPEIMPIKSYTYAIILGIFNGLGATGSNQILKQMKKFFDKTNNLEE